MEPQAFDAKMAKRLDGIYRTRDMLRRRRLVHDALAAAPGERVLDLGCGPGFYTEELSDRVGPAGRVVGVDGSRDMLALAEARCGWRENVELRAADVTSPPLADGAVDAVVCVQVLEYVPDVARAFAEVRRVLRDGGRFVVWDTDWSTTSWHSAEPDRMRRVLHAWDAHLVHPSLPRTLAARLRAAGFTDVRVRGHTFATTELAQDTFGGTTFTMVEPFVAGHDEIGPAEAKAWADEQRALAEAGEFFFACTQFCFTATKPGSTGQDGASR